MSDPKGNPMSTLIIRFDNIQKDEINSIEDAIDDLGLEPVGWEVRSIERTYP